MTKVNGNQFLPEEIVTLHHYDKKAAEWVESEFPKVGGRLRIAHEQNGKLDITTEVIQYDGNVAVVKAIAKTDKGIFSGIGMASIERDAKIAPAILELAETRAIARSLRFAGYGVEYCSAEEISHMDQDKQPSPPPLENDPSGQSNKASYSKSTPGSEEYSKNGGNNRRADGKSEGNNGNGQDNSKARLSQKQHSFLLSLADDREISRKELDERSKKKFGCVVNFLSKGDASSFIKDMTSH